MNRPNQLVVFSIEEQRYALSLSSVERVIWAVAVTPLPKAPAIISGVINIQGDIVPVIDVRKRFRMPEDEVSLTNQFIIAHTARMRLAMVVDAVAGVIEYPEDAIVRAETIVPGMEYIEGILRLKDGLILIHDLENFLSLEEEKTIDEAMAQKT